MKNKKVFTYVQCEKCDRKIAVYRTFPIKEDDYTISLRILCPNCLNLAQQAMIYALLKNRGYYNSKTLNGYSIKLDNATVSFMGCNLGCPDNFLICRTWTEKDSTTIMNIVCVGCLSEIGPESYFSDYDEQPLSFYDKQFSLLKEQGIYFHNIPVAQMPFINRDIEIDGEFLNRIRAETGI